MLGLQSSTLVASRSVFEPDRMPLAMNHIISPIPTGQASTARPSRTLSMAVSLVPTTTYEAT